LEELQDFLERLTDPPLLTPAEGLESSHNIVSKGFYLIKEMSG
jgi:hypothetical protein